MGLDASYCVALDGTALKSTQCARTAAEQALQLLLLVASVHRVLHLAALRPSTQTGRTQWLFSLHVLLVTVAMALAATTLAIALFQLPTQFTAALLVTSALDTVSWLFVACVFCLEHTRAHSRQSPLVLLLVIFAAIYDALAMDDSDDRRTIATRSPLLAHVTVASAASVAAVALVGALRHTLLWTSRPRSANSERESKLLVPVSSNTPSAFDRAGVASRLTYAWLEPLLTLSAQRRLEPHDVPELPKRDATELAVQAFQAALDRELRESPLHPSLLRVTRRLYGAEVLRFGAWSTANKALGLTNPLLLKLFLDWAAEPAPTLARGYALAAAMATQALLASVSGTQYALAWQRFDLRVRAGVVAAIYARALALSATARRRDGALGRITNLVSVDVGRVVGMPSNLFDMVLIPIEIAVALLLLRREVAYAFVAGVAVLGVMLPLQTLLGRAIQTATRRMLAHRDKRVEATAEALRAVRPLKLLAWVNVFVARIAAVRRREFAQLAVRKYLDAACVFFWAATPVLVQTAVFAAVIFSGHDLTAANAFTAVALLDRLIYPMNYFPWIISGFLEARVSALRIRAFVLETDVFAPPQLLPPARATATAAPTDSTDATADDPHAVVEVSDCIFTWRTDDDNGDAIDGSDSATTPLLLSPSSATHSDSAAAASARAFELCVEQLVLQPDHDYVVCGPVGAGKSSLLLALLGEMRRQSGRLRVARRRVAFAPQTPWLFRGSVRQNITMCGGDGDDDDISSEATDTVDEQLYRHVLRVCELERDLRRKPAFDRTAVGEHGNNLSGGQRLRVSLARALYQRTALYLLDDPLSGLDPRTAARIVTNCLGSASARHALFPDGAAVVLVTHSVPLVAHIAGNPHVLVLADGQVVEHGAFSALRALDSGSRLSAMLRDANAQQQQQQQQQSSATSETAAASASDNSDAVESTTLELHEADAPSDDDDTADSTDSHDNEHREAGAVHLRVWRAYASAIGAPLTAALALSVVAMQLSRNALDWWLAVFTNAPPGSPDAVAPLTFAHALLAIAGVHCAAALARSLLFAYGGLRAARRVYAQLAAHVFGASLAFFGATPAGRVLNRLSGDTYAVDESLPFALNRLVADVATVLGALIVLLYANALVLLLLLPLGVAYAKLQRRYRPASRHLRRLDAAAQSPLLALVADSLAGLAVLRALQLPPMYAARYTRRLRVSQRMAFASANASAWFGLRLDLLGVCVTAFAALSAVAAFQITARVRPGVLGLSLTYALPLVSKLNAALGSFVATEQQMIAVERVHEYATLPSEEDVVAGSGDRAQRSLATVSPTDSAVIAVETSVSSAWPQRGAIEIRDLSVAYPVTSSMVSRPGDSANVLALRNVSCRISAGEKIGVCGRTGAGKSTLLHALFRAVAWTTGSISIDSVDLAALPLHELRARLTYVPQDTVLFAGSVRSNLDPASRHADHALWAALAKCGLDRAVAALARGLDSVVEADDATLSRGQSQLLGVARALLRPSKVLCIDEATASVDRDTEQLVVKTLETEFANSTVIVVAHRIQTIMGCDRVLVLDDGQLVETGTPHELVRDPTSRFSRLAASNDSNDQQQQ